MYYKNHVKRMRIDICNLEKTNVILEILWLQAHNPKIDWETEEVKMTGCPPLYRRSMKKEDRKGKRVMTPKEEKIVKWAINNKKRLGKGKRNENGPQENKGDGF